MRCARCGRFIGEECVEGHDGTFYGGHPGAEDGYTGVFYCAYGVGCNAIAASDERDAYPSETWHFG